MEESLQDHLALPERPLYTNTTSAEVPINLEFDVDKISMQNLMNRNFIRKHVVSASMLLFLALFLVVQTVKPAFLYEKDGSIRNFGLGYTKSTVLPMWAITVVLAITAYYTVMYYLAIPRMKL